MNPRCTELENAIKKRLDDFLGETLTDKLRHEIYQEVLQILRGAMANGTIKSMPKVEVIAKVNEVRVIIGDEEI
jgi:hypothetical protein